MADEQGTSAWYVYILRCADDTLYTGITTNLERRVDEHNSGKAGAKYTRSRRPVEIVYYETASNRSVALKREYWIKSLSLQGKRGLIAGESG